MAGPRGCTKSDASIDRRDAYSDTPLVVVVLRMHRFTGFLDQVMTPGLSRVWVHATRVVLARGAEQLAGMLYVECMIMYSA